MNLNDREVILYAFAIEPNHDRQTVERYLRQYPEIAEDLIDISSERRLREAAWVQSNDAIADPHWKEAWEQFRQHKPQGVSSGQAVSPFSTFRGQAFAKLAETLSVPRSFLTALRDGLVQASSIPERFVRRLAQTMGSSIDSLRNYFANPQASLLGRAFKSDDKPSQQGQVTFEELVQCTNMSTEQRQRLLEDCKDYGLDRGRPAEG
ncbi:MAG: hypothetical protein HJJLKODD_02626 [Phycisphaerae bacterium]|nr:hypothetical protein [Phycisphaerae bacterium]